MVFTMHVNIFILGAVVRNSINVLSICSVKALSHGAIFLATCNAILLLRDAN